ASPPGEAAAWAPAVGSMAWGWAWGRALTAPASGAAELAPGCPPPHPATAANTTSAASSERSGVVTAELHIPGSVLALTTLIVESAPCRSCGLRDVIRELKACSRRPSARRGGSWSGCWPATVPGEPSGAPYCVAMTAFDQPASEAGVPFWRRPLVRSGPDERTSDTLQTPGM